MVKREHVKKLIMRGHVYNVLAHIPLPSIYGHVRYFNNVFGRAFY